MRGSLAVSGTRLRKRPMPRALARLAAPPPLQPGSKHNICHAMVGTVQKTLNTPGTVPAVTPDVTMMHRRHDCSGVPKLVASILILPQFLGQASFIARTYLDVSDATFG